MLVAYSVNEAGEGSRLDGRFGRCPFFALVAEDDGLIEYIPNPGAGAAAGAGTGAAQQLVDREVGAVVTGQVGPKAWEILEAAGIPVYLAPADLPLPVVRERWRTGGLRRYQIQQF